MPRLTRLRCLILMDVIPTNENSTTEDEAARERERINLVTRLFAVNLRETQARNVDAELIVGDGVAGTNAVRLRYV